MKKITFKNTISLFLISIIISAVFTINASAAFVYGDVNRDNEIDARDLVRLKKYVAGISSEINVLASDINCDDEINAIDLSELRNMILNNVGLKEVEVSREPDEIENF